MVEVPLARLFLGPIEPGPEPIHYLLFQVPVPVQGQSGGHALLIGPQSYS